MNLWNHHYRGYTGERKLFGEPTSAKMVAAFFDDDEVKRVEDWGCGYGGFKEFLRADQKYIGIDGSDSPYADVKADLVKYKSRADAILLRHVLEHNGRWDLILRNALASFVRKLAIVIFTPFRDDKSVVIRKRGSGVRQEQIIEIAFRKKDIVDLFPAGVDWSMESVKTDTIYNREHIFYLEREP